MTTTTTTKETLNNPALDDFQLAELMPRDFYAYVRNIKTTDVANSVTDSMCQYNNRVWLSRQYAWAIPDEQSLRAVANYGPFVESGAGAGYWAYMLAQLGCPVQAYDPNPPSANEYCHKDTPNWYPVADQSDPSYQAALQDPQNALLLCWPRCNEPDAADALEAYAGDHLVYIGDVEDGCTGNSHFFYLLEKDWELIATQAHPASRHFFSHVWIYQRKS